MHILYIDFIALIGSNILKIQSIFTQKAQIMSARGHNKENWQHKRRFDGYWVLSILNI